MPRRWLRRRLPTHKQLQAQFGMPSSVVDEKSQSWLATTLAEPMLWHLNRRSVAGGVAVGLFVSWLPVPMQMLLAGFLAAVLRVHVPASVVSVWFSNPFTVAPLLYAAWYAGSTLLGQSTEMPPFELSLQGIIDSAANAWPELLLGALFCGSLFALLGYVGMQLLWRIATIRKWRHRAHSRPNVS